MRRARASKAVNRLRDAAESPCPHCGRNTRTTSDGVCADCWTSKGGHPMGWRQEAPRGSLLDDIADFFGLGFLRY